ncbi:MAG: hypothetical protein CL947_00985 [Epsilonproteobacteria bacterium]|nr:hypothetical protein [Campylobacterota bacterium]
MKKLFIVLLLSAHTIIYNCNLCYDYTGRRLRKQAMSKVTCDCNCQQQKISRHIDGHRCVKCNCFVMPHDIKADNVQPETPKIINEWKQNKLQRYQKPTVNDTSNMYLIDYSDTKK